MAETPSRFLRLEALSSLSSRKRGEAKKEAPR
jgi:hypothetical protein